MCVICCFSLAAFNICSLYLIFVNLINMCLGMFRLEFILFLYLLAIPVSLHLVEIAEFGVSFCILEVCGVLFIVAFPRCVWVCTGGLSRFPG